MMPAKTFLDELGISGGVTQVGVMDAGKVLLFESPEWCRTLLPWTVFELEGVLFHVDMNEQVHILEE